MKILIVSLFLTSAAFAAPSSSLSRDRAAILGMAGKFEVKFNFTETVALAPDYELKKPYTSKAHELVKVVEDTGKSITLQHLLVVDGEFGPAVIKHWAQVWRYEDPKSLDYEGKMTWMPVTHSEGETKGTWTQFVTQIDDSPRYKAQGSWNHEGGSSVWTSKVSTRPLPRRDYTKRKDYDLLVVVNHHIITPDGWVHQQDNRKLVSREGKNQFLCVEAGLNAYMRITDETSKEGFEIAEKMWEESKGFWKVARHEWLKIADTQTGPIHYAHKVEGKRLMSEMRDLAEGYSKGEKANLEKVSGVIAKYLR